MPRPSGQTIPKYRKHRASGQAVVTLHGKDHYLGPHNTKASKLKYDLVIGEWLAGGRNPLITDSANLSVVELCARYFKFAVKYYQKDGKCTGEVPAIKAMIKAIKPVYGEHECIEFGPLALKATRLKMIAGGWARSYANSQIARVKRMFKWGVSEQLIPIECYQTLATVAGLRRGKSDARESDPVLPVEDEHVEATLPFMSPVVADMVRLQRLTGMRPAEVCILRPCDLERSGQVWEYRPESHKTEHHGKQRLVFIGPQGQEILLRYLARDSQAYCFRPCDSESKRRASVHSERKTPLSCGNRPGTKRKRRPKKSPGERYDSRSYWRAIKYACDKAFPIPESLSEVEAKEWKSKYRWAPNQLRHTAATEIRRKFGLEAAQVILGHSRADVTQVYAERDIAKGLEVAAKIG
jgi:integrase